eukprot:Skav236819  [mRNA]  locus=scaffold2823:69762:87097:- [translate_table: standard]
MRETCSTSWLKKEWETFIDGMDANNAWNNYIFVPLTGEWRPDGSAFYTEIREKRDWIRAMQKSQWQGLFGSKPQWSFDNLVGFMLCPVGFALVQYIVFLVHKIRSNLPEDAARVNLDSTRFAFVTILDFTFDHLESSNWNTSSFDLAVNLNLDRRFYPTYSEYIRQMAPLPLHFPSWREEWQGQRTGHSEGRGPPSLGRSSEMRVALVGEHGPSNLDHLAALQQAVAHPIEAGHFFSYLWQLEGGLADSASLSSSLRITWDAFWGQPLTQSAGRDQRAPLWTIQQATWALGEFARRDPFLRSSEVIICSEPLWLCVLLHAALPESRRHRLLTRANAAGRVMCLLVDFDQVFGDDVDALWSLIEDLPLTGGVSATSRITAEVLHWQLGIRAPYVPSLSLYISARYESRRPDVLFFRSSLPSAAPFLRILRLIEAENEANRGPSGVNIDLLTTSISFSEMATYRSIAMLPHIPNALRLSDVYAMGIPLLIPDEPMIHKFIWPTDPLLFLDKIRHPKLRGSARDLLEKAQISRDEAERISRRMLQHQEKLTVGYDDWRSPISAKAPWYVQRPEAMEGAQGAQALSELFSPGQLVVAVVLATLQGQKRLRLEASLRPSLVNAGLTAELLRPNMWLPAAVVGEEEHVLRLDFGVEGGWAGVQVKLSDYVTGHVHLRQLTDVPLPTEMSGLFDLVFRNCGEAEVKFKTDQEQLGYIPTPHLSDDLEIAARRYREIAAEVPVGDLNQAASSTVSVKLPDSAVILARSHIPNFSKDATEKQSSFVLLTLKQSMLLACEAGSFVVDIGDLQETRRQQSWKEGRWCSGFVRDVRRFGALVCVGSWRLAGVAHTFALSRRFVEQPTDAVQDGGGRTEGEKGREGKGRRRREGEGRGEREEEEGEGEREVGQSVRVLVSKVDTEKHRFEADLRPALVSDKELLKREAEALRLTLLQKDFTQKAFPKKPNSKLGSFLPGSVVQAEVTKVESYGLVLSVKNTKGITAVALKENMPEMKAEVGTVLKCAVLDFNAEGGILDVSLHPELVEKHEKPEVGTELQVLPALSKKSYCICWSRKPAAVLFAPPYAPSTWKFPTKTILHSADADSDEEPWKLLQSGSSAAFEFAEFKAWRCRGTGAGSRAVDSATSSDGEKDDEEGAKKPSKRQRKAMRKEEEKELRKREEENADGQWADNPRSVEDFERLLLTQGDTSIVWIRYMAFHLKMSDLERARQVAERAVKHVGFSDSKERFNVWVAYLNLECTFGTEKLADAVFGRAASHNDAKQVGPPGAWRGTRLQGGCRAVPCDALLLFLGKGSATTLPLCLEGFRFIFLENETKPEIETRPMGRLTVLQVHMQLAKIHERNKKTQLAVKAHEACARKFPHSKKVWIAFLTFLYEPPGSQGLPSQLQAVLQQNDDAEGARKVLVKALAALERRKHPVVVSKAAILEYQTLGAAKGKGGSWWLWERQGLLRFWGSGSWGYLLGMSLVGDAC